MLKSFKNLNIKISFINAELKPIDIDSVFNIITRIIINFILTTLLIKVSFLLYFLQKGINVVCGGDIAVLAVSIFCSQKTIK